MHSTPQKIGKLDKDSHGLVLNVDGNRYLSASGEGTTLFYIISESTGSEVNQFILNF